MIDIEKIKKNFKIHAEKYDMNDIAIIRKFYHSYRVMDFCMLLAKYNNFNDDDTNIAMLVGLLHDYSRFEQWTNYKTYSDIKSIDHGDLAVERLFKDREILNYCKNIEYYDEIYDAIKYHNKYSYPEYLSEHNKLLCKIIRDADKLDIFYLLGINKELIPEDDGIISNKVKEDFYNNKSISRLNCENKNDDILLSIAMIFDLNFNYSFKYIKDMKLIDKIYENIENKTIFKPYFDYINKYIEKRCQDNG